MDICVLCHAGYRGEETPRLLRLPGRDLRVLEVVRAWREPGGRMFVVSCEDGEKRTLRCHEPSQTWELLQVAGSRPKR